MTFRLALAAHLACAFGATALFWIPLFASKGGPLHLAAGRLYVRLIYLTCLTGAPMAALLYVRAPDAATRRTALFLAYLLLILVMPVFHGVRVARARRGDVRLATPFHTALCVAAIGGGLALGAAAIVWREGPYLLLSPLGPVLGGRALMYARAAAGQSSWREEHIISMVMSGIAVHTALLVFGSTRTLGLKLTGAFVYVPWLLPALIGVPLVAARIRRERATRATR